MNIFKTINATIQIVAKAIAFIVAIVFAGIGWAIYQIYKMNSLVFGTLIWLTSKIHFIFSTIIGWVMWLPTTIAQLSIMFALDISQQENKERMEAVMEEIKRRIEEKQEADQLRTMRDAAKKKAEEHDPS